MNINGDMLDVEFQDCPPRCIRIIHKKNGAPQAAVIRPTGISCGAMMVRPITSMLTKKQAPTVAVSGKT